jgi:ATP-dependent helicase/nuclease subunit A
LQHFNFALLDTDKTRSLVDEELSRMTEQKLLAKESLALLKKDKLVEILSNPVFAKLTGLMLYREQQFLVSLPASELPVYFRAGMTDEQAKKEEVLFQGAIDLMALSDDGRAFIIDYKYSEGGAEYLRTHYAAQLALYKKAVCKILRLPADAVSCTIVNICRGFEVKIDV